jgi:hypothetical protein
MINKISLSPLIATILLIVVTVVLATIILTWGKDLVTSSVQNTDSITKTNLFSDRQYSIRFLEAKNGRYFFDYHSPPSDVEFTVVSYAYVGYPYVPLEPEKTISSQGRFYLDLGIVDEDRFSISLLLDDGSYLNFENVTNVNRSPSPSDCPVGYIPVPGNHLYGTVGSKGGFCVMKYEAKVDEDGDGIGDVNATCQNSNFGTWNNNGASCSYTLNNRVIVSSAVGYPLATISLLESITACESINSNLITNDEWMTIARNIERVSSNWSSNIIGTGYIYSGHSDNLPPAALASNINDNNGYYLTGQTTGNQKRTLILNNGEIIWDFAGNVFENSEDMNSFYLSTYYDNFADWTEIEYSDFYKFSFEDLGLKGYKGNFLLNSDYNSDAGVGRTRGVRHNNPYRDTALIRSGYWNGTSGAGILSLDVGDNPTGRFSTVGFRCVYYPE